MGKQEEKKETNKALLVLFMMWFNESNKETGIDWIDIEDIDDFIKEMDFKND
jgi:hypothetical protein